MTGSISTDLYPLGVKNRRDGCDLVQFPILDPVSVGLFPGRVNMTWPILGPGVSYLQKFGLVWSVKTGPCCQFPPGSDLVYSSRLDPVSVWLYIQRLHCLVPTGPWCQLFTETGLVWLCRLDPVVSFCLGIRAQRPDLAQSFQTGPWRQHGSCPSLAWSSLSD